MRRHKPETAMAGHRAWAGCTGWSACGLILMAERTPSGRAAVKDGALARHPKGSSLIAARPGGTLAARINRLFSCLRADRLSAENRLTSITDATFYYVLRFHAPGEGTFQSAGCLLRITGSIGTKARKVCAMNRIAGIPLVVFALVVGAGTAPAQEKLDGNKIQDLKQVDPVPPATGKS